VGAEAGGATVLFKRQTHARSSTALSTHFTVGGERKKMQIQIHPGTGVIILFPQSERHVALAVLKALYTATGQEFIKEAIKSIEEDLKPKALPFINYWHWCTGCGRDLDERDENAISITKDGDTSWKHRECPPLKKDRPI
jgi:hypothetical protein